MRFKGGGARAAHDGDGRRRRRGRSEAANAKTRAQNRLAEKEAQERSSRTPRGGDHAHASQQSMSANTSTAFSDAASDFKTDPPGSEYNSASQSAPERRQPPETSPRDSEPSATPAVGTVGTPFMTPGGDTEHPGRVAYASAKSTLGRRPAYPRLPIWGIPEQG